MENVFLILGPEKKDAEDKIQSLLKSAAGAKLRNYYAFNDGDVNAALSDIQGSSLFGDRYFVVLDGIEVMKSRNVQSFVSAVSACKSDNFLILKSDEAKVAADFDKCVKKENKSVFYQMFENQKKTYVVNLFRSLGFSADNDAASAFLALNEHDKKTLSVSADKLISSIKADGIKTSVISAELVYKYLDYERDDDALTLFSYIASRNIASASVSSASYSSLFPALVSYVRKAISHSRNLSEGRSDAWTLSYAGGRPGTVKYPREKDFISLFARNYTPLQMKRTLKLLIDGEMQVRLLTSVQLQNVLFANILTDIVKI